MMTKGEFLNRFQRQPEGAWCCTKTIELDAVGSVLCHGFHPSKARLVGQFLSSDLSPPKGPTPERPLHDQTRSDL